MRAFRGLDFRLCLIRGATASPCRYSFCPIFGLLSSFIFCCKITIISDIHNLTGLTAPLTKTQPVRQHHIRINITLPSLAQLRLPTTPTPLSLRVSIPSSPSSTSDRCRSICTFDGACAPLRHCPHPFVGEHDPRPPRHASSVACSRGGAGIVDLYWPAARRRAAG